MGEMARTSLPAAGTSILQESQKSQLITSSSGTTASAEEFVGTDQGNSELRPSVVER